MRFTKLLAMMALVPSIALSANLGTYGQAYPVTERSFLELILARAKYFEESGKLEHMKKEFIDNTRKRVERPEPVQGLKTTTKPETTYHYPTFTLSQDIYDGQGNLIYAKGTTVNAFDHLNGGYHDTLIFLDADDLKQVAWAQEFLSKQTGIVKVILTNGNLPFAVKALKQRIYFDQGGIITKRLGIKHIPAVVTPDYDKEALAIQTQDISHYKPFDPRTLEETNDDNN